MKHSNTTVFTVMLIVMCTVSIDVSWQYFLEKSARTQAVFSLNNIQSCVNTVLLTDEEGLLTNYRDIPNGEIEKALKICAGKSLITPTGDVFAFDLRTKDFIFDPSLDCYVEGGKSMEPGSECLQHLNPVPCEWAMGLMLAGYNSSPHTKAWWQFDGGREYLEWKVLPDEQRGYDGIIRGGAMRPHQVVVAQGVQEDELHNRYKGFRVVLYGIGFVSIIINLMLSVHSNLTVMRQSRRAEDG